MPSADYADFFLNSSPNVAMLELLELFHPSWTTAYRVVRNATKGVTVTQVAPDPGTFFYTYYPLEIEPLETGTDLDQELRIKIGDLGGLLQDELDRVADDNLFGIKPSCVYRCYRSDDLTQELYGPISLQIDNITFSLEGAQIDARAPIVSSMRTGERFTISRFPMMRNIGTAE